MRQVFSDIWSFLSRSFRRKAADSHCGVAQVENIRITHRELTFGDIHIHYHTGRSHLISSEGRNKVFGYRHGVMTDIGDLSEDEWTRMAKQLIEHCGEQELYRQLFAWEKEHSHWKRKGSQFELDVLSMHIDRLPDDSVWCDFIPFNRKYRPEALPNAELLWAKCTGCGKLYELTREQLENIRSRNDDELYCQKCGGWMPVRRCAPSEEGEMKSI